MKILANEYEPKDIIKIIRKTTNLSQKDFASTINCSKDTLQSYELGRRNYSMEKLLEIANIHKIEITLEKK